MSEDRSCYKCKNFMEIGGEEGCFIYGTPNHDVSYCDDWIEVKK